MFYYERYDPVPRNINLLCFQKIIQQLDQPVICGENSSKTGGKSSLKKVSTGCGPSSVPQELSDVIWQWRQPIFRCAMQITVLSSPSSRCFGFSTKTCTVRHQMIGWGRDDRLSLTTSLVIFAKSANARAAGRLRPRASRSV
jgi:hypothetical protein